MKFWHEAVPSAQLTYLTHNLDVSDLEGGTRASFGLVVEHGQHEITRLAETLPHKECPGLALGLQQCLCLPSRHVAMVPPRYIEKIGDQARVGTDTCQI